MPGSTPAFATSDAVDGARAGGGRRPASTGRRLGTPAAAVGLVIAAAWLIVAALAPLIAPADPFASVAAPLSPPARGHAFGTDDLGRDLLSGVVHGARTSLLVASTVT